MKLKSRILLNLLVALTLALMLGVFSGCEQDTKVSEFITYKDDLGREVKLPLSINRIAPSGKMAQMLVYAIAPDYMVCLAAKPTESEKKYFGDTYTSLKVTGQLYGRGSLNLEELIAAKPQVIIDAGEKKKNIKEDLDQLMKETGIPVIFIQAKLEDYPSSFRKLGKVISREDRAEELAKYTEDLYEKIASIKAGIPQDERVSAMFGTGESGLDCNAKGSMHAEALDFVGVENKIVVNELSFKGGGNTISMEELIKANPDILLFEHGTPVESLVASKYWSGLSAVSNEKYYTIPRAPYHFLANPPSINRIIGLEWLAKTAYPDYYDFDLNKDVVEFFKVFWNSDIDKKEAAEILKGK